MTMRLVPFVLVSLLCALPLHADDDDLAKFVRGPSDSSSPGIHFGPGINYQSRPPIPTKLYDGKDKDDKDKKDESIWNKLANQASGGSGGEASAARDGSSAMEGLVGHSLNPMRGPLMFQNPSPFSRMDFDKLGTPNGATALYESAAARGSGAAAHVMEGEAIGLVGKEVRSMGLGVEKLLAGGAAAAAAAGAAAAGKRSKKS